MKIFIIYIFISKKIPIKKEFLFYLTTSKASKISEQRLNKIKARVVVPQQKAQKLKRKKKLFYAKSSNLLFERTF